jgi:hypothetical protein
VIVDSFKRGAMYRRSPDCGIMSSEESAHIKYDDAAGNEEICLHVLLSWNYRRN